MGRHSAPPRIRPRLKRTAANAIAVLLVTSVVSIAIYAGIASFASAKADEVPPPTIVSGVSGAPAPGPGPDGGTYSPQAGMEPESPASGSLRTCPVTGCAASTCHAETGDPPPGR
jgi:hypothetical protein